MLNDDRMLSAQPTSLRVGDNDSPMHRRNGPPATPLAWHAADTDHNRDPRRVDHDAHRLERLAGELRQRQPTRYERWAKPLLDRSMALLLLVLLSPIMVMLSVVVVITIGRPVLLRQARGGRGGTSFAMLKFRTMLPDRRLRDVAYAGPERRVTHKSADDPRHTLVGRIMRKLSLDELPQLINVVGGHMSLVGPRPEMMQLVEGYAPWQHCRHLVRPGLTGLWQTTERGSGRVMHECVDLDLQYISTMSFRRDMAILLRTPSILLRSNGVI